MDQELLNKFNRTVIEAIHGKDLEDVDETGDGSFLIIDHREFRACDLSRLLKALPQKLEYLDNTYIDENHFVFYFANGDNEELDWDYEIRWELTKPDGYTTATAEDQTEETLIKILELFKQLK